MPYFGRHFSEQYRVRNYDIFYEELINDPAKSLKEIFTWLRLEDQSQEIIEAYTSKIGKIYSSSVGIWENEMSSSELTLFEKLAGSELKVLGYPVGE